MRRSLRPIARGDNGDGPVTPVKPGTPGGRPARPSRGRRLAAVALGLLAAAALGLLAAVAGAAPPVRPPPPPPLRHVILLIADGAGYNQAEATALWHGAPAPYEGAGWSHCAVSTFAWIEADDGPPYGDYGFVGLHGYDPALAWASWTYLQNYATDSAAAATAMATGHKTYNAAIGTGVGDGTPDGRVILPNLTERAEAAGWATGVVTSVPLSHATPAAFAAHEVFRSDYANIALDLTASGLEVVMGAGHPDYDHDGVWAPGNPANAADWAYVGGYANWQALVAGTAGGGSGSGGAGGTSGAAPWTLIDDLAAFEALADGLAVPARVFGVAPVAETLQQRRAGAPPANGTEPPYAVPPLATVPSLELMTRGALNVLSRDPDGFFLMVEGGAVDWAAHAQQLGRLIEEMDGFRAAVAAVAAWVELHSSWDETLVIVTSDHETGSLWGPGVVADRPGTWFRSLVDNGAGTLPGFQFYTSGHSNQLVPLHARGRGAELLAAAADQHDSRRGAYLDNTEIAQAVFALLDGVPPPPPPRLALQGNRPNPFNPATTIPFELSRRGRARLTVHDAAGRLVRTLLDAERDAGPHEARWDGADDFGRPAASGVYLCCLAAEGEIRRRAMSLVR